MPSTTSNIHQPVIPVDTLRHDWTTNEVVQLFELSMNDLLFEAQTFHRANFNPNEIQLSTLLSIKTGGCAENCGYCSQSAHHNAPVKPTKLMNAETVISEAEKAKHAGSTRYCMGAAWRNPKKHHMAEIVKMVTGVKSLGMETCMTLGMLDSEQAAELKEAGLDYYNHNIDTSREFYGNVITTRKYEDRLDTLRKVQGAGINVCSGGIVGMGESRRDRANMLITLANLRPHPGSVPINMLVQVEGTPMFGKNKLDKFEFIRTIAVARIMMPKTMVRLSAGREEMSDEMQSMCFFAGANSMFVGPELLTTPNPERDHDKRLMSVLGLKPMPSANTDETETGQAS